MTPVAAMPSAGPLTWVIGRGGLLGRSVETTLKGATGTGETVGQNGRAANVLDGNSATVWHTQWQDAAPPPPHEIQLDLARAASVSCVFYLPRQDAAKGRIARYEVYTSTDGVAWGSPAASGTWADTAAEQTACFSARSARYLKVRALSEVDDGPWSALAELRVAAR